MGRHWKGPPPVRKPPSQARAPVEGRLVAHRDGYGFVITDEPLRGVTGDIFIGPAARGDALHGDRVLVSNVRVRADGRAEGHIQRVLERAQTTVETKNAEIRKNVLKYDEVMNEQRKVIYRRRDQILEGVDLKTAAMEYLAEAYTNEPVEITEMRAKSLALAARQMAEHKGRTWTEVLNQALNELETALPKYESAV